MKCAIKILIVFLGVAHDKYQDDVRDMTRTSTWISTALLCFAVVLGIGVIPILLKCLNGVRRVFVILQQLSFIFYLLLMIILDIALQEDRRAIELDYFYNNRAVAILLMQKKAVKLFQYFFYYSYYFVSLMQSIDIYKMV